MRYLLLMPLATVLVCGGCGDTKNYGIDDMEVTAAQCQDLADNDADGLIDCADPDCQWFVFCIDGGGGDTDTGSDSDSASDIDTETAEEECGSPTGITDWGGPCHTNADCPPDTECLFLSGMDDSQAFCAAECCNYSTQDTAYCTDVAGGQEGCIITEAECSWALVPPFYCAISCNTAADCPLGTDCVDSGGGGKICYGYAPATDAGVDGGP